MLTLSMRLSHCFFFQAWSVLHISYVPRYQVLDERPILSLCKIEVAQASMWILHTLARDGDGIITAVSTKYFLLPEAFGWCYPFLRFLLRYGWVSLSSPWWCVGPISDLIVLSLCGLCSPVLLSSIAMVVQSAYCGGWQTKGSSSSMTSGDMRCNVGLFGLHYIFIFMCLYCTILIIFRNVL